MTLKQCRKAFVIYEKFVSNIEKVADFLAVAKVDMLFDF